MVDATLNNLLAQEDNANYYTAQYRIALEDHMTLLREAADTVVVSITPQQAYKYQCDLTGLFFELGLSAQMHHAVMRVNDLNSLIDVPETFTQLLVPSEAALTRIANLNVPKS